MSFQNKVFVLKLAIAFVLISTGILKLIEPVQWVEWIPAWFSQIVSFNKDHVIFVMGTIELFLGLWLLTPWYAHITATLASVYLVFIVAFEGLSRNGLQDIGLWIATIALTMLLWPKKMQLFYQDH